MHVSRYGDKTRGSELVAVRPQRRRCDRVVLVLDDILDEGETMAAIRDKVLAMGAKSFHSAVFANKLISKACRLLLILSASMCRIAMCLATAWMCAAPGAICRRFTR